MKKKKVKDNLFNCCECGRLIKSRSLRNKALFLCDTCWDKDQSFDNDYMTLDIDEERDWTR